MRRRRRKSEEIDRQDTNWWKKARASEDEEVKGREGRLSPKLSHQTATERPAANEAGLEECGFLVKWLSNFLWGQAIASNYKIIHFYWKTQYFVTGPESLEREIKGKLSRIGLPKSKENAFGKQVETLPAGLVISASTRTKTSENFGEKCWTLSPITWTSLSVAMKICSHRSQVKRSSFENKNLDVNGWRIT